MRARRAFAANCRATCAAAERILKFWMRCSALRCACKRRSVHERLVLSPLPLGEGAMRGAKTMTRRADLPRTRAEFLAATGVLLVVRETPPAPPPAKGQPTAVAG